MKWNRTFSPATYSTWQRASAQLREGAGERYLLRLARGGDASTAAGVTVKISDLTAKYGRDYTISILDSKEKVENPSDNESLLEMMEGEEYTESELVTEEDYLSQMEEDDELYQATVDAYNDAIEYIESESGVDVSEDPDTENDPATQPEESVEGENSDAGCNRVHRSPAAGQKPVHRHFGSAPAGDVHDRHLPADPGHGQRDYQRSGGRNPDR